jgi:Phage integrase family
MNKCLRPCRLDQPFLLPPSLQDRLPIGIPTMTRSRLSASNIWWRRWHGWHAARQGLGSNLYRLGVPDMVIQRILRHANVSTTATYYIRTAADDVRIAMTVLENRIDASGQIQADALGNIDGQSSPGSSTIQQMASDSGHPVVTRHYAARQDLFT